MKNLEKYPEWFILKFALHGIDKCLEICEKECFNLPETTKTYRELKAEFENAYNLAIEEERRTQ